MGESRRIKPHTTAEAFDQIGDAFRAVGHGMAALFPRLFSKASAAQRAEYDHTLNHGRALGMDEAAVREVIAAWFDFYLGRPDPLPWGTVRSALTARAFGEEWRP